MGQHPHQPEPGEPYRPAAGYQPYGQPPYGSPHPPSPYYAATPYGVDPATGLPLSDKSKVTAGILQLVPALFGICGIGRLYTGHTGIGLAQLLGVLIGWVLVCFLIGIVIVPAIVIWTIVDGIMLLAGSRPTDAQGRLLRS